MSEAGGEWTLRRFHLCLFSHWTEELNWSNIAVQKVMLMHIMTWLIHRWNHLNMQHLPGFRSWLICPYYYTTIPCTYPHTLAGWWRFPLSEWESRLLRCSLHFLCEDLCFSWCTWFTQQQKTRTVQNLFMPGILIYILWKHFRGP